MNEFPCAEFVLIKSHRKILYGLLSGMWGWQDSHNYGILKNDGTVLEECFVQKIKGSLNVCCLDAVQLP